MSISEKLAKAKEVDLFCELSEEEKICADLQASIAIYVHNRRLALGMTQSEFAKALNVTQAAVSKWESGECNFTLSALAKLFSKIGSGLSFEFNSKSEPKPSPKLSQTVWKSITAGDNKWNSRAVPAEAFTV